MKKGKDLYRRFRRAKRQGPIVVSSYGLLAEPFDPSRVSIKTITGRDVSGTFPVACRKALIRSALHGVPVFVHRFRLGKKTGRPYVDLPRGYRRLKREDVFGIARRLDYVLVRETMSRKERRALKYGAPNAHA